MPGSRRELWLAFLTILVVSLVYGVVIFRGSIPGAGELFGHLIGVAGFVMMLMTETLYSLRKRSRTARWGRMSSWLKFHIYTGVVGPYLVLLHTSWKFNGLAGIAMLLTAVIVASGFIGRYIYTAVPRNLDGAVLDAEDLKRRMSAIEVELQRFITQQPEAAAPLTSLLAAARANLAHLERLHIQRRTLQRQVDSLVMARRLLGLWQSIHIPIGMALFTTAFIHAGVALYYATLLK